MTRLSSAAPIWRGESYPMRSARSSTTNSRTLMRPPGRPHAGTGCGGLPAERPPDCGAGCQGRESFPRRDRGEDRRSPDIRVSSAEAWDHVRRRHPELHRITDSSRRRERGCERSRGRSDGERKAEVRRRLAEAFREFVSFLVPSGSVQILAEEAFVATRWRQERHVERPTRRRDPLLELSKRVVGAGANRDRVSQR